MANISLDQRWQGWPEKDPKRFLFPLGSPRGMNANKYKKNQLSKN